jgi:cytochrome c biogenesis protein CcdA/thiol-disulfide isomerase/thioredoxin
MAILLLFAFMAGIITILSPCILPILPVILAGGVGGRRSRPFGIVLGFVISFTFFTLALTAIVQAFGISPDDLRIVAVIVIIMFGLVLLIPQLHQWFQKIASRIANIGQGKTQSEDSSRKHNGLKGLVNGLPVGFSLGLVWTPCAGPIMASVISLALTESLDSGAVLITLAYSLGTAIPMLLVMLTGRTILNRVPFLVKNTAKIQKVFGVLMIVVGLAIGFNWDRQFQSALLGVFPDYGTGLTSIENIQVVQDALKERDNQFIEPVMMEDQTITMKKIDVFSYSNQPQNGVLGDYGKAPEIVTNGPWLNTRESFSMKDLLGKVVLIDFWTYSCINCIRTIPYLKSWYDKYKDDGFVIIGVHTPEFEFEKNESNVKQAIEDLGVDWPVVLDNEYRQWQAYSNRYWPAHFFIDVQGHIRYFHFGEGYYETSEGVIRDLLEEGGKEVETVTSVTEPGNQSKTPETYLGYGRATGFLSEVTMIKDKAADYIPADNLENGKWTLDGRWTIAKEYIIPEDRGSLQLKFNAKNVYLVVEPEEPGGNIVVKLDGDNIQEIPIPDESRLYELVNLPGSGSHILNLEINGRLRLFAFTFG